MQRLEELLLRSRSVQVASTNIMTTECGSILCCVCRSHTTVRPYWHKCSWAVKCRCQCSRALWPLLSRRNLVGFVASSLGNVEAGMGLLLLVIGMTHLSYELLIYVHIHKHVKCWTLKGKTSALSADCLLLHAGPSVRAIATVQSGCSHCRGRLKHQSTPCVCCISHSGHTLQPQVGDLENL